MTSALTLVRRLGKYGVLINPGKQRIWSKVFGHISGSFEITCNREGFPFTTYYLPALDRILKLAILTTNISLDTASGVPFGNKMQRVTGASRTNRN